MKSGMMVPGRSCYRESYTRGVAGTISWRRISHVWQTRLVSEGERRLGIRPVNWRGWLYAIVCLRRYCLPFVALLATGKVVESLIWVVAMMFMMLWDVQSVLRDIDVPMAEISEPGDEETETDGDVLVIDENTEPPLSVRAGMVSRPTLDRSN